MLKDNKSARVMSQGRQGFVMFAAFIGAAVYFVQHSDGFGGFILAILKAIVWPAFLLYHVLETLHV